MIFVTVGTHEQQFDRLIKAVDKLAGAEKFKDNFLVQSGYSTYRCRNCNQKKFMSYSEMKVAMEQARIVICHGGPSTFMKSLSLNKGTIVVPRRKKYAEHVNDHQLHFAEEVVRKGYPIEVVENVNQLESAIRNCTDTNQKTISNNKKFNDNLISLINKMMVK